MNLNEVENALNKQFEANVRSNIKAAIKEQIAEFGGCNSRNYYEWLAKSHKEYGESLVAITYME